MTTITIPARDMQTGDVIPNLGLRVALNADSSHGKRILYFGPDDPTKTIGSVHLDPDALVTVERPDPDAELVERILHAMTAADGTAQMDYLTDSQRKYWRKLARAALAVVRAEQ